MKFTAIIKIVSLALLALAFGQTALAMAMDIEPTTKTIFEAAEVGNLADIEYFLNHGVSVNAKGGYGNNPLLHIACLNNRLEAVQLLLERGADINRKTAFNLSPLQSVLLRPIKNMKIIKLLLENGADANSKHDVHSKYQDNTILYHACKDNNTELVSLLLEYGADANSKNEENLLYDACEKNHTEVAKLLLDHGATAVNYKCRGQTPLYHACRKNNLELAKKLLQNHAIVDEISEASRSSLLHYSGESPIIQLLLDNGAGVHINTKDYYGSIPLHYVCYHRKLESARLFLNWGADINSQNKEGQTPLHRACSEYPPKEQKDQEQLVRLLLNNGADINCEDKQGKTALDLAHSNGYTKVAELLINEPQRRAQQLMDNKQAFAKRLLSLPQSSSVFANALEQAQATNPILAQSMQEQQTFENNLALIAPLISCRAHKVPVRKDKSSYCTIS